MKRIIVCSLVVFCGLIGVSLFAGSGPAAATRGCHGRIAKQAGCHGEALIESGCHGLRLVAPAAHQAEACHGRAAGRLTLSERLAARSMARQNYNATLAAGREAARSGDGISAVSYDAPAMMYVPASSVKPEDKE